MFICMFIHEKLTGRHSRGRRGPDHHVQLARAVFALQHRVFRDFKLLPNKTVFENVAFASRGHRQELPRHQDGVPEVSRLRVCRTSSTSAPRPASGGEQQRCVHRARHRELPAAARVGRRSPQPRPADVARYADLLERINRTWHHGAVATYDREMVDNMRRRVIAPTAGTSPATRTGGALRFDAPFALSYASRSRASRATSTTPVSIVTIFLSLMIIGVFLVGGLVIENVAGRRTRAHRGVRCRRRLAASDIDKVRTTTATSRAASVTFTDKRTGARRHASRPRT